MSITALLLQTLQRLPSHLVTAKVPRVAYRDAHEQPRTASLMTSPTALPLALATLASLLFPKHSRNAPSLSVSPSHTHSLSPLFWLSPLPGTLFPQTSTWGTFQPLLKSHFLTEAPFTTIFRTTVCPTPRTQHFQSPPLCTFYMVFNP